MSGKSTFLPFRHPMPKQARGVGVRHASPPPLLGLGVGAKIESRRREHKHSDDDDIVPL